MANEQSIQLVTFNFGSITIIFQQLAQRLNRLMSIFASGLGEKSDPKIQADWRDQYFTSRKLIVNIKLCFSRLKK